MTGARRKKHCKVVPSKGCDSTWFRDLQTDYFKSVVALANEVIDFASHTVLLFDKTRDVFARRWHYLYGLSPLTGSKSQIPTTAAMRKILHSGSAVVSVPTGGKRTPSRPVQLIAPLVLLGRPSGLLIMEAPAGSTFSVYDAYLADSVVAVAASGVDQDYDSNLLRFVEFCILHRRRFFSAFPSLDEELQGCLERILGEGDLASLAKKGMLHGNVRTPQLSASESSRLTLKYAAFYPPLSKAAEERARQRELTVSRHRIETWITASAKSNGRMVREIDPQYKTIFPGVRSHIAVPCLYKGVLYAILSIDSASGRAFYPLLVRALSVLAAQAAPVFANAMARSELSFQRAYLQKIIDEIPDELCVLDDDGHIIMMNRAKLQAFPVAHKGDFCFEAFEHGRRNRCEGCYAQKVLKTGYPIRQALWKQSDIITSKPRYVELSAGLIRMPNGQSSQVVEIVRPVTVREAMADWLEETHRQMLAPRENPTDWLWQRVLDGLSQMGFNKCRTYTFSSGRFHGKACVPEDTFAGKHFSRFFLDPSEDIVSMILLEKSKLRPVRFLVDDELSMPWKLARSDHNINYTTCYLSRPSPKLVRYMGKTTHIYNEVDTYTAKLRVTNSYGYSDTDTDTVVVNDPTAVVVYTYDEVGNRDSMTDPTGNTSYTYDYLNRLISVTNPDLKTISYQYDAGGNRTQLTDPSENITTYDYDDNNRLIEVDAPAGSTTYQYDSLGNLTGAVYPNGTFTEYSYNPQRNWLVSLVNKSSTGTVQSSYSYTCDYAGNRSSATENDGSVVSYSYDDIYQLASETRTGTNPYTILYQYDNVGNRTQMTKDGNTTYYYYNNNNQLTTDFPVGFPTFYSYDDNGNLVSKTSGGNTTVYTWDWRNLLLSVSEPGGNTSYEYDGDGTRISKTQSAVETKYINDVALPLIQVLMETDDTGTVQATYTYGNDLISMNRSGVNSYYHYDGLGSTRQLTDSTGSVTVSYTYDSFGNLIDSTGTSDNTYGFTGEQQFEEADNLVFLRARYYDPRIGRFISRDPMLSLDYYAVRGMDLQKLRGWQKIVTPRWLNPYVYCLNNPVNLVDPTGGCGTEVPDEITEETLKKVVELAKEYGVKDLEGIYNACENWRSWCSDDLADCQACATLECLYKLPSTLGSYKKCLEKEYPKCASMSAFRKEKKKLE